MPPPMKYNRGPLVPHSLLKLVGNVYIRHLVQSRRYVNGESEIRKICWKDYWPREGIRATEKAKPGSTKYTKGKKSKRSSRRGSGQTQAAADHKGAFKPKPLIFRLLALTSLEVEGRLWSTTALFAGWSNHDSFVTGGSCFFFSSKISPIFLPMFPLSFYPETFHSFDRFNHLRECDRTTTTRNWTACKIWKSSVIRDHGWSLPQKNQQGAPRPKWDYST